jgi:hypothetical protein
MNRLRWLVFRALWPLVVLVGQALDIDDDDDETGDPT